jgi:hypothetical protein
MVERVLWSCCRWCNGGSPMDVGRGLARRHGARMYGSSILIPVLCFVFVTRFWWQGHQAESEGSRCTCCFMEGLCQAGGLVTSGFMNQMAAWPPVNCWNRVHNISVTEAQE